MKEAVSATKNHTSGKVGHKLFHVLYPSWCVLSDYNEHDKRSGKREDTGVKKGKGRGKIEGRVPQVVCSL